MFGQKIDSAQLSSIENGLLRAREARDDFPKLAEVARDLLGHYPTASELAEPLIAIADRLTSADNATRSQSQTRLAATLYRAGAAGLSPDSPTEQHAANRFAACVDQSYAGDERINVYAIAAEDAVPNSAFEQATCTNYLRDVNAIDEVEKRIWMHKATVTCGIPGTALEREAALGYRLNLDMMTTSENRLGIYDRELHANALCLPLVSALVDGLIEHTTQDPIYDTPEKRTNNLKLAARYAHAGSAQKIAIAQNFIAEALRIADSDQQIDLAIAASAILPLNSPEEKRAAALFDAALSKLPSKDERFEKARQACKASIRGSLLKKRAVTATLRAAPPPSSDTMVLDTYLMLVHEADRGQPDYLEATHKLFKCANHSHLPSARIAANKKIVRNAGTDQALRDRALSNILNDNGSLANQVDIVVNYKYVARHAQPGSPEELRAAYGFIHSVESLGEEDRPMFYACALNNPHHGSLINALTRDKLHQLHQNKPKTLDDLTQGFLQDFAPEPTIRTAPSETAFNTRAMATPAP